MPVAYVERDGREMYAQAAALELEGLVAKRAVSVYQAGRTSDWLKIKTPAGKARVAKRKEPRG